MLESGSDWKKHFRIEHAWFFGILVVAAFLRLKGLNFQSLWGDELFSIYHSSPDFSIFRIVGVSRWDPHPPLFLLLLHSWMKLFGYNEFSPRLFTAVIGILSVFPVVLLGKEIFNRQAGLIAGLLVSVNFYHLYYSQEVRPYILLFLFTTLSFLFFIKDLKEQGKKNRLFYVLYTILMLYTHYYGLFILLSQFIYLAFYYGFQKKLFNLRAIRHHLMAGLMMVILYVPMIWFVLKMMQKTDHWIKVPPKPLFFLNLFGAFFGNEILLNILFSILLLFLVVKCILKGRQGTCMSSEFKSLLFSIPVVISWIFFSLFVPYLRSLIMVPMLSFKHGIYILAGILVLIAAAIAMIRPGFLRMIIIVAVFMVSVSSIYFQHDYYGRKTKQQWREAVTQIRQAAEGMSEDSMAVLSEEIRYSQCYFDILKSDVKILSPTFLNLKNCVKKQTGSSLNLLILDWEEQPIQDRRFLNILSRYFTRVETRHYISVSFEKYELRGQQLQALKALLKIA